MKPKLFPIAAAANTSIVYNKKRDEMYRMFPTQPQTGRPFLLAHVPSEMKLSTTRALGLNAEDQHRLYQIGFQIGLGVDTATGWRNTPPGTDAQQQVLPRSGLRFMTRPGAGAPSSGTSPGTVGEGRKGLDVVPPLDPNP